jgi:hypothetical protein
MALGNSVDWIIMLAIFVFLFLAVWLPCCLSDIVFPLLFVREGLPLHDTWHIINITEEEKNET